MKPYSLVTRTCHRRLVVGLPSSPRGSVSTNPQWKSGGIANGIPVVVRPCRTLHACDDFIRAEVKRHPDATLDELCARVQEDRSVSASPSMMCRELQHLDLPRKKSRSTTASARRPG
jgi:transposase